MALRESARMPSNPPPAPRKRAVQRCPNCAIRCDVSCFVDGALARCGHCNVRFEVCREKTPPPPIAAEKARAPETPRQQGDNLHRLKPPEAKAEPVLPQLDGFTVQERIGVGGMGEVFRCTRESDRVPVAVKILTAQMAAVPDYVRRFGREAAAMAQLDHRSHQAGSQSRELGARIREWAHGLGLLRRQ